MTQERYLVLGVSLAMLGSVIVVFSARYSRSVVFEAVGFAVAIVGLTALSLPEPESGNETTLALLRGSMFGIEPLLHEISTRRSTVNKARVQSWDQATMMNLLDEALEHRPPAIYLPPHGYEGQNTSVYIPLIDHSTTSDKDMRNARTEISPADNNQHGISVYTAGSTVGLLPEVWDDDLPIEETLKRVLVQSAKVCSGVKVLEVEDSIILEISDVTEGLESNSYRALLGSFPVSIAASIIARVKGVPIEIESEQIGTRRTIARLAPHNLKGW